jgi:hypothetical protein
MSKVYPVSSIEEQTHVIQIPQIIPSLYDRIPSYDTLMERIKERWDSCYFHTCRSCELHRTMIAVIITCLIIIALVVINNIKK